MKLLQSLQSAGGAEAMWAILSPLLVQFLAAAIFIIIISVSLITLFKLVGQTKIFAVTALVGSFVYIILFGMMSSYFIQDILLLLFVVVFTILEFLIVYVFSTLINKEK